MSPEVYAAALVNERDAYLLRERPERAAEVDVELARLSGKPQRSTR